MGHSKVAMVHVKILLSSLSTGVTSVVYYVCLAVKQKISVRNSSTFSATKSDKMKSSVVL